MSFILCLKCGKRLFLFPRPSVGRQRMGNEGYNLVTELRSDPVGLGPRRTCLRGGAGVGRAGPGGAGAAPPRGVAAGESGARTYHALLWLDEGPAEAVHLAVEAAGVAQVVAGAVPPPERRLDGAAVHAFATLGGQVLQQVCGESGDERPGEATPCPPLPRLPRRPPVPLVPVLATHCHLPRPRPSPRVFPFGSQAGSWLVPIDPDHSLHP